MKKILLSAAVLSIAFVACKKDEESTPDPVAAPVVVAPIDTTGDAAKAAAAAQAAVVAAAAAQATADSLAAVQFTADSTAAVAAAIQFTADSAASRTPLTTLAGGFSYF